MSDALTFPIQDRDRLLSAVVRENPTPVLIADRHGRVVTVNAAFESLTGYTFADIGGRPARWLLRRATPSGGVGTLLRRVAAGATWRGQITQHTKAGERVTALASVMPVPGNGEFPDGYVVHAEDRSQSRQQAEHIRQLTYYDWLTGVANRQLLAERAALAATDQTGCVALLSIDLPDFPYVNDVLGHAAGDTILTRAARCLEDMVTPDDTVARLGGHAFAVLLTNLQHQRQAVDVAEHLLDAFATPFTIGERHIGLAVNVGIAVRPTNAEMPRDLLQSANIALKHAKAAGSNTCRTFTADMNERLVRQFNVKEALRGGLRDGEFSVVYQPVVALDSGRVTGAEALLRWDSAILGRVGPDEFIEAAEINGLVRDLGRFALDTALTQCARWRARTGAPVRVAVNVSPQQLQSADFANTVAWALERADLPGNALEIELTETVLLHSSDGVTATLDRLRRLGARLALDDFGTGYACLKYLRDHPFDTLKIDKRFVQESTTNATSRKLVLASLSMASALDLDVVAEGAETPEQVTLLRQNGCVYAQGYHFWPPLTPATFCREAEPHMAGSVGSWKPAPPSEPASETDGAVE